VAVGIGQLSWAEQCFRLAVALDPNHGEALNNLGVLESKKGQVQQVRVDCQAGAGSAYARAAHAAALGHAD
jgi:tetratricopeptide repeat protein 8